MNVTGRWKEFKVKTKQGMVTAVTIGALARSVGCSIKTLRDWERKKLIPKTKHESARGDRLYTPGQVLHIKQLAEERGLLENTRPSRRYYTKKWIKYGKMKPVEVVLFRVGTFAKLVGRNISSILQMENRSALPETPFRSGDQRLYTYDMIVAARDVFVKWEDTENVDWIKFGLEIRRAWTKQKVFNAEIDEPTKEERDRLVAKKKAAREAEKRARVRKKAVEERAKAKKRAKKSTKKIGRKGRTKN